MENNQEIEDWMEENSLAQALLKKSNLKKEELKALLLYFQGEDTSFSDLSSEMGISRSGAWKRWKKGYEKVIESFYTLELAVYGGILDLETTKLMTEDLKDYLRLAHKAGDLEEIRMRLEKRMAQMEKEEL